jgi:hypothetical protein
VNSSIGSSRISNIRHTHTHTHTHSLFGSKLKAKDSFVWLDINNRNTQSLSNWTEKKSLVATNQKLRIFERKYFVKRQPTLVLVTWKWRCRCKGDGSSDSVRRRATPLFVNFHTTPFPGNHSLSRTRNPTFAKKKSAFDPWKLTSLGADPR